MFAHYFDFVMRWVLVLALFPMAFFWLRRAWRIFGKRDYSEVALKRGESPPRPEKWATLVGLINLAAGLVVLGTALGALRGVGPLQNPQSWIAVAGSTIWIKIFLDFIISRQAHPMNLGRKKKKDSSAS
ncbi:MAG: hypothetical protein AB7F21_01145 [Desulfuromonadales bacterium]|uniref:hypothetical protein n=1 Tax=Desulfuromonas sp. KJ2020 TaxID=2919173 RepID=UPI0020A7F5AC|nr:hypothetical protein [Desulfuromonas sp. KJ2020]MCP3175590.1 hypothetical protein [Desulfuromonas sp. KJ2020]